MISRLYKLPYNLTNTIISDIIIGSILDPFSSVTRLQKGEGVCRNAGATTAGSGLVFVNLDVDTYL